jgi:formylglycine-generating enzyme required for sulfatase activity
MILRFSLNSFFGIGVIFLAYQAQAELGRVEGAWNNQSGWNMIVTRDAIGGGWNAWLACCGQGRITVDTTYNGANIKLEGRPPEGPKWECWFFATLLADDKRMNWRPIEGRDDRCKTATGYFDRAAEEVEYRRKLAQELWPLVERTPSVEALESYCTEFKDTVPFGALCRSRLAELKPCGGAVATIAPRLPQALSATEECTLKPGDIFKECDKCPEMVVVPPALDSFTMGSQAIEAGHEDDEGPQHSVTIPKKFAVGKFHITVDQFSAFVKETKYDAGSRCSIYENGEWRRDQAGRSWRIPGFPQTPSQPVVCINWKDADAYVRWLSRKTSRIYRLLTEAEREYAARAGTATRYFFGDDEKDECRYGNGGDQTARSYVPGASNWASPSCSDGYAYTAPVGHFSPNAFGLYDMLGNAWTWVQDCYHENYTGAPSDGSAWEPEECDRRALRGGSWRDPLTNLRSASRGKQLPATRLIHVGFRVARTL